MITLVDEHGQAHEYGTAAEIAAALTSTERPVTADMVRGWARRGLITRHHRPGRGRGITWYPLLDAARAERDTRPSIRRALDAA
jgi:hypothetical protein